MLEFKITQELKPNPKLLELIKDFTYKTKKAYVFDRCEKLTKVQLPLVNTVGNYAFTYHSADLIGGQSALFS